MTNDDATRLASIDIQIGKLRAELRELEHQAAAASGSAIEELIAQRIENAELRLNALDEARHAILGAEAA
jgi:hypothetical protein